MDLEVCPDHVGPQPVPARQPVPPRGWRCARTGAALACVDRAAGSGPFRCQGDVCEQRFARLPDDGTWECADLDGAVVCHGGTPPAGVVAGPAEPGWRCGDRRGVAPPVLDRVCVDLSPDFPDAQPRGWRCSFSHDRGEHRVCRRDAAAPALGAPCADRRGCPPDDRCASGRCVPAAPVPSCWLDADCGEGRCRRGSCS